VATQQSDREPPIPGWLYPIVNPLVMAAVRSPLGRKLNGAVTIVTLRGRKSGRRISTPVGYTRRGGTVTMLVHGSWWRNLRGGAEVSLYLDGGERPGRATATADPAELLPYLRRRLGEVGGVKNARRIGLTELAADLEPSDAELLHAARGSALVRVELADGDGA
jgi:hypothetical protein